MKTKNKRILSILISMNMLFSFAGCSNTSNEISSLSDTKDSVTSTCLNSTTKKDKINSTSNTITHYNITTKPFVLDEKNICTTTNVNLREKPSTDSNVITVISAYEKLKTIKSNDNWYYVSYDNNDGYVASKYVQDLTNTYVEVDISDQNLYLYVDDELSLKADVVTGKKGIYDTRLGCHCIYSKETQRYLKGDDYNVYVDYWLPFDKGQGIHDATWRTSFNKDDYLNGSHGCVNMKYDDAKYVYDNVSVGTKVLVHK